MASALSDKKHHLKLLHELYFAEKWFLSKDKIINEIFNGDEKVANRIIEHLLGKYIKPHDEDGKEGFQLKVPEGIDYLFREEDKLQQEKREKEILKIQQESSKREDKILTIQQETSKTNKKLYWVQKCTLAVLVLTLTVAGYSAINAGISAYASKESANYSYLTYQATLDALIPNSADIVISRLDNTIFDQRDLIANKPLDEFKICVENRGRMDSGQIILNFVNERDYFPADDTTFYIEEVSAGEENCTEMVVRHHQFGRINESAIPTGNTTLKLRTFCNNCDKNKEQYHNISICIRNSTNPC